MFKYWRSTLAALAACLAVFGVAIQAVPAHASAPTSSPTLPHWTPPKNAKPETPHPLPKNAPVAGILTWEKFHPATKLHGGTITVSTPSNAGPPWYYQYSSAFAGVSGTETSGSVTMTTDEQGLQQATNHYWQGTYGNHSLSNFVVAGTCDATDAANGTCTSAPLIEIMMENGQEFCHNSFQACWRAIGWKNGQETNDTGYVNALEPDDGTYHPGGSGTITLGYRLVLGYIQMTVNGTIVGYWPDSYWGAHMNGSFGPITEESVQSEAMVTQYNDFGSTLEPSMGYTFSGFTDSNGNTLPAPAVSSGYSTSGASGTGWTVSGGRAPSDTSTAWPIELNQDQGETDGPAPCIENKNGTTSNGNPIIIGDCSNWTNKQAWRWNSSDSTIRYQGLSSFWCLDDPSNSTTNGTQLVLQNCTGLTGEKWTPTKVGHSYIQYKAGNNVVCINDPNGNTVGAAVTIQACSGSSTTQQNDTYDY